MFTELLAESEIPAQGILFLIVMVFSFLKWLFGKLTAKKEEGDSDVLESLYDQYREEIRERQAPTTAPQRVVAVVPPQRQSVQSAPPALPKASAPKPSTPYAVEEQKPRFNRDDVERARRAKQNNAYERPSVSSAKADRKRTSNITVIPLHKKLRHKGSLRQALLVKEILSEPKAFQ